MNYLAAFVGQVIVSKVLVDGEQIPYEHYKKFSPQLNELEGWATVFTGLELDKPATWAATAKRLVSRVSQSSRSSGIGGMLGRDTDTFEIAMNKIGYNEMNKGWYLSDLVWEAVEKAEEKIFWKDDKHVYSKIYLPHDQFMIRRRKRYKKLPGGGFTGADTKLSDTIGGWRNEAPEPPVDEELEEYMEEVDKPVYAKTGNLFIPSTSDESEEKAAFFRAMGELLFADRAKNLFTIDWNSEKHTFVVEPLTFPDRPYRGDALAYIDEWIQYMEKGVRRCICLQGEPGTGKSTLTRTAALKINKRTVKVTSEAFRRMHFHHWKLMIALMDPDVVIIDDIDRIYDLEEYLDRFEDAYYSVPLTLFTSNDLDEIPDAFKRPGRIDQILELGDPSADVRLEVLQEFARMEGAGTIPEWKVPFVEALYSLYSGAYAVEYMRRVAVFGWDYKLPKDDLTFPDMVGKEDELDPRLNPDLDHEMLKVYDQVSRLSEITEVEPS